MGKIVVVSQIGTIMAEIQVVSIWLILSKPAEHFIDISIPAGMLSYIMAFRKTRLEDALGIGTRRRTQFSTHHADDVF